MSSSGRTTGGEAERTLSVERGGILQGLGRQPLHDGARPKDPSEAIAEMILRFKVPNLFGAGAMSGAVPILAYCAASILMTVTNKGVLSGYAFTMNFLLLAIQCLAVVALLEASAFLGLIQHRPFRLAEAKAWFPVSLLLAIMIYTGSKAVQYLSISLFTVFKNTTIIAIAYAERVFLNGPPVTNAVLFSFGLMILSSVIAGWADLTSETGGLKEDAFGVGKGVAYFWMLANCIASAAYAVGMRGAMKHVKFKEFDVVFYNNLLATPLLIVASFLVESEQWRTGRYSALPPEDLKASNLFLAIVISSISSFAISYCSSWCVRATSSTTFSMAGALNKLPIAVAGMVVFGDPVTPGSVLGVGIAFAAGIVYTKAKSSQPSHPPKETLLPVAAPPPPSQADTELDKLLDGERAEEKASNGTPR